MICPRCYFVVTLVQMVQIICIIPIFGVIFCKKKMGIWPSCVTIDIGLPPTSWQLILKKYHHAVSSIYFCGHFALSNGPNLEVVCIITIFGLIFGQNLGIWPSGWPYIRLPAPVSSRFVLDVFFVVTFHYQMVEIGKLFACNTNNWGHLLVNIWVLDLPGSSYIGLSPTIWCFILKKFPLALS